MFDSNRGYFGCVSHYVIRTDGRIETARNPRTISPAPKGLKAQDHLVVTVVGGQDTEANMVANNTDEQEAALETLLEAIANALDQPIEITDLRAYLRNKAYAEYLAHTAEADDDDPEASDA